jgi:hypothetical protein
MATKAGGPPPGGGFGRQDAAAIRAAWAAGVLPECPGCRVALDPTPVPPRRDVAYVRDRVVLVCRSCGRSAAVERRLRGTPLPAVPAPPLPLVGWREWVRMPDHSPGWLKVKVDTGARTSALHVEDVALFRREGTGWLRFTVLPRQRTHLGAFQVEAVQVDERNVRSSSGSSEERPVVRLRLALGATDFSTEVTLTRRDQMGFRMLLGRTALRNRFLVHPAASYLQGTPTEEAPRKEDGPAPSSSTPPLSPPPRN